MSTKAEEFRYWTERSGAKKAKGAPRARRDAPVDTALPGVSATNRKAKTGSTRKPSTRAGKKAVFALEGEPGKRPSRKSTRKSGNRQRTDAKMRVKQRTEAVRPSSRASRS